MEKEKDIKIKKGTKLMREKKGFFKVTKKIKREEKVEGRK